MLCGVPGSGPDWTTMTTEDGLPDNRVTALWGDDQDILWVGTAGGLGRYDGETWTTYTRADGLVSHDINCIYQDVSGALWVGTREGVSVLDGPSRSMLHWAA